MVQSKLYKFISIGAYVGAILAGIFAVIFLFTGAFFISALLLIPIVLGIKQGKLYGGLAETAPVEKLNKSGKEQVRKNLKNSEGIVKMNKIILWFVVGLFIIIGIVLIVIAPIQGKIMGFVMILIAGGFGYLIHKVIDKTVLKYHEAVKK